MSSHSSLPASSSHTLSQEGNKHDRHAPPINRYTTAFHFAPPLTKVLRTPEGLKRRPEHQCCEKHPSISTTRLAMRHACQHKHRRTAPRRATDVETVRILGGRACISMDVWGVPRPAVKGRSNRAAMVLYLTFALKLALYCIFSTRSRHNPHVI